MTDKPILIKANAGLPDPATGKYDITAQDFAEAMLPFRTWAWPTWAAAAARAGLYPRVVSATAGETGQPSAAPGGPSSAPPPGGGAGRRARHRDASTPRAKSALSSHSEGDMDYIVRQAVKQADPGPYPGLNVGVPVSTRPPDGACRQGHPGRHGPAAADRLVQFQPWRRLAVVNARPSSTPSTATGKAGAIYPWPRNTARRWWARHGRIRHPRHGEERFAMRSGY